MRVGTGDVSNGSDVKSRTWAHPCLTSSVMCGLREYSSWLRPHTHERSGIGIKAAE